MKRKCRMIPPLWRMPFVKINLYMGLFFLMCVNVWGTNHAQTLSLSMKQASLKEIFRWVEQNSGYRFLYKSGDVAGMKVKNVKMEDATVEALLDYCLANTGLVYERDAQLIVVKQGKPSDAAQTVEEADI